MREYPQFYINGEWLEPIKSKQFEVINPATEEIAGHINLGSKDDVDKAYIIAISYYIFDMLQMVLLQYRRNLMQHIIFTLHHVGTIYVMIFDNYVFQAIVYKLELSNIALVLYYYLKDITWCKSYLQILQFCWYSYFRIFSVIPHFYETLLLKNYEMYCLYIFYMMGVYWSMILMYRIIVE